MVRYLVFLLCSQCLLEVACFAKFVVPHGVSVIGPLTLKYNPTGVVFFSKDFTKRLVVEVASRGVNFVLPSQAIFEVLHDALDVCLR